MKKLICILSALMLSLLLAHPALAASVNYVGGAEGFVFLPGSQYSRTDMFENFKNCVPGDVLTQEITVRNISLKNVRIYMKAEPVREEDRDFLSQMHMTVKCADETIFEAAPSQTAQLTDYVLLGAFKNRGTTQLTVELTIPHEMGNQYMGAIGVVPWTFMVEELEDQLTPHTGDWYQASTWLAVAGALLALIVILLVVKRRKAQEN